MRQRQSVIPRKVTILAEQDTMQEPFPVILADSIEVMENYYRSKVQVLENSLTRLNLLEDAKEIVFLCREITHAKAMLRKIFLRKKI